MTHIIRTDSRDYTCTQQIYTRGSSSPQFYHFITGTRMNQPLQVDCKHIAMSGARRSSWLKFAILPYCLLLLTAMSVGLTSATAQTRYTIRGKVTDNRTGEALRGVRITVDRIINADEISLDDLLNTNVSTKKIGGFANESGQFTINALTEPGKYKVTGRLLGYRSFNGQITLAAGGEIELNIRMSEDVVRSQEVVVTGMAAGTTRKQLGNSIGTVSAKDIQAAPAPTIDAAMAGKFSGALIQQNSGNPSGGVSIRLRGTNTYSGNADPLYIIDGVLVNNDSPQLLNFGGYQQNRMADINPNDIERIEVLKGAAAAAIYGSRANNGVVQIFTKSGSFGAPKVTFTQRIQTDALAKNLPMNLEPLAPAGNAFNYRLVAGTPTANQVSSTLQFPASFLAANPQYAALQGQPVRREDIQDLVYRRAWGMESSVSIDGGAQGTRYSLTGTFFNNQGILQGTSFQRASVRLRVDQTLNDWASLQVSTNFINTNSQEMPNEPLGTSLGSIGYGVLLGVIFSQNFVDPRANSVTGRFPGDLSAFGRGNPLETIQNFNFNQKVNRFIGSAKLTLTPMEGLNIEYLSGLDTYSQNAVGYIPPNTSAFEFPTGLSRAARADVLQMNNDLTASYRTNLMTGLQSITQVGGTLQYERRNFGGTQSIGLIPIVQIVPGGASGQTISEFRSEYVLMGAFAQQTFNYQDKLILTGALRVDASSAFGVENRTQLFPKFGTTYLLSEEEFWKNAFGETFNQFKLRLAYGESGGLTAIGPFDRFTAFNSSPFTGQPGLSQGGRLGTPDIKPERQREWEFGFDMNFLNDRVSLEVTYYDKLTRDILLPRTIASSTGFTSQLANVGTLQNKGIEVMLRGTVIEKDGFQWNSTIIANRNTGEMRDVVGGFIAGGQYAIINGFNMPVMYERYYARNADGSIFLATDGLPRLAVGTPAANANGGTETTYNANGTVPAGQPATVLRKVVGDPTPRWTGSFINEFRYENFTLRVQVDGMFQFDVLNYTRRTSTFFGTHEDAGKELRGDLPPGSANALVNIFESYVEKGDFVRLRELSLSYDIPNVALAGIKNARFTFSGRNLFLSTNYRGYDPEVNSAGQGASSGFGAFPVRGADFATVPIPRSYSFTMQLGF